MNSAAPLHPKLPMPHNAELAFADSHCHLNYEGLAGRTDEVLQRMAQAGVRRALNVCTTLEEADQVVGMVRPHEHLVASVGVHPDYEAVGQEATVEELVRRGADPKIAAIGETGLDYFRLKGNLDWQRERFRVHIRAARTLGKPLIIHTREAPEDTLRILREESAHEVGGVMHCFTESWEVAQRAMELNFLISLSGIVTFKNATQVHEVAEKTPIDRLMIETDSPFLAPVPHRGKTNEPAWVVHVAQRIADLKGMPLEAVAKATMVNFERFASVA
ncbi:MAG: TatD family hydrolase [Burkholderiaceae bacterium]